MWWRVNGSLKVPADGTLPRGYIHTIRPPAGRERMQCGDETDTDSNAYLVIELQFVKVSQDGSISRIVHVPL